ncbi:hypothetical protein NEIPOLOT_02593 [Neisseria polysaccharea ATCC 43768]|nr:hypothetical protein NEIPOLOT_02593 [Neisseria polysaccharea ATCC 43768]
MCVHCGFCRWVSDGIVSQILRGNETAESPKSLMRRDWRDWWAEAHPTTHPTASYKILKPSFPRKWESRT